MYSAINQMATDYCRPRGGFSLLDAFAESFQSRFEFSSLHILRPVRPCGTLGRTGFINCAAWFCVKNARLFPESQRPSPIGFAREFPLEGGKGETQKHGHFFYVFNSHEDIAVLAMLCAAFATFGAFKKGRIQSEDGNL